MERIITNESLASADPYNVQIFKCPPSACERNNACSQNRSGPVCGACSPGFAMTSSGCSPNICPSDSELLTLRIIALAVFSTLALGIYLAVLWRPVLPELDYMIARMMQAIVGMFSYVIYFGHVQGNSSKDTGDTSNLFSTIVGGARMANSKIGGLHRLWKGNHMPQYLKIFVRLPLLTSSLANVEACSTCYYRSFAYRSFAILPAIIPVHIMLKDDVNRHNRHKRHKRAWYTCRNDIQTTMRSLWEV